MIYPCYIHLSSFRNMLEKLSRLLKVKQRLSLDPISGNDIPADRYAVFKIEVSAMLYFFFLNSGIQISGVTNVGK